MKYILEPMLFAVSDKASKDEFEAYIDNLIDWGDWLDAHGEDIYMLSESEEILYGRDFYPQAPVIKKLIKDYNIKHVSYDKVDRTISKIIRHSRKLDDEYTPEEEDLSSVKYLPKNILKARDKDLNSDLSKLIWFANRSCVKDNKDEYSFTIFTRDLSMLLKAEITYIAMGDADFVDKKVNTVVNCKTSLFDFLSDPDTPMRVWVQNDSKDDIEMGIRISIYQNQNLVSLDEAYENYDLVIQDSFYDQFCENHYANKGSDLRSAILACMYAVTHQNLALCHDIRKSKCGGSPQLVVNGYGAWRRNSTTSIKIAYWTKGKKIRLADIAEHDFIEPTQQWD